MDFPLDPVRRFPVYEGAGESFAPMDLNEGLTLAHVDGDASTVVAEVAAGAATTLGLQNGFVDEGEDSVQPCGSADGAKGESSQSVVQPDPKAPGWSKRLRVGKAPLERTPCPGRIGALEQSVREFAEIPSENVIKLELGMSFTL